MLGLLGPQGGAHAPAAMPGLVVAGAGLLAAATVAGAWLARRRPGQQQIWLGAAAGALLVIAGMHLLPDAWSAARAVRIWPWAVPATAIATFLVAGVAARGGCACRRDTRHLGGAGAAAALAAHRFLEGSALVLIGSAAVVAALAVHALGEGMAVGALLRAQPPRRVATWLAVMCVSPVVGALVTSAYPIPGTAEPLLLAVAAGVLAQAARVSLRAACQGLAGARILLSGPAAATTVAAAITVLAVHAAG
jgi:ZIP family zinc transporter